MRFLLTTFLVLAFSFGASGQESSKACEVAKSPNEFYVCLLKFHPIYKSAMLTRESAKALRDKVTQFSNPELSLRTVGGKNAGEEVGSTEISATVDVSNLVFKRPAISEMGRSEEKLGNALADEEEFRAKSTIIRDLFRYRQIEDESALVNEALEAFGKIIGQFRSRKAMGPDQQITLNLVELATGEYQLQKNHLSVEKQELDAKFKGIFGDQFVVKKEWIPKMKLNWPEISLASITGQTFELKKAEAENSRAQSEKSLANAEAFPQVSAGPIWERTTDGPSRYQSVGVGVTVSLPLLSLNGGARSLAEQNKIKSQLLYDYAIKKENLDKQMVYYRYKSAIDILKNSISAESVRKKHDRVDSFFRQGLASGGTVIEAHRQILTFTESQHEHELTALDAYIYLSILAGMDSNEVFK